MAPTSIPLPYPLPYRLFLLYIEPLFTLSGAIAAFYFPTQYLSMTYASPPSLAPTLSPGVHVVLRQLGNLYCAFALIEALVLRSTNDVKVWRALLLPLLIADFGHLLSVLPVGKEVYWEVGRWGAMDWGNLGGEAEEAEEVEAGGEDYGWGGEDAEDNGGGDGEEGGEEGR
ncbi:MAG: hypothetical protein Q9160_001451 [Pyrenula sp. 1 TL-2023]